MERSAQSSSRARAEERRALTKRNEGPTCSFPAGGGGGHLELLDGSLRWLSGSGGREMPKGVLLPQPSEVAVRGRHQRQGAAVVGGTGIWQ